VNIGHRYLAPVYPILFMAAGLSIRALDTRGWRATAVAGLLTAHGVSSFVSFPGYLSYFNFLAGGSSGGWRYLVDSNVDWGQDLRRLKAWMDRSGVAEVHLAYFGTGDPRAYGIKFRKLQVLDWRVDEEFLKPEQGAYVAVSATLLQGLHVRSDISQYLRMLRLRRQPVARVGDSIFIYREEE
jgi:hypothetical protein